MNPKNGRVVLNSLFEGNYANYSCDLGYGLLGLPALLCLPTGLWNSPPPVCYSKQLSVCFMRMLHYYVIEPCGNLPPLTNGKVIISGRTPGSTATYLCNEHYRLIGNATIICQSNSQWLGVAPKCKSTWVIDYDIFVTFS